MQEKTKKALILVDLQNDFCKGGSLAVPDGDAVIAVANSIQNDFDEVIITKDWHPANHQSFASQHVGKKTGDKILLRGIEQILWPDHCVQNTEGSELHPQLKLKRIDHIVFKGTQVDVDSYSAFFDNAHLRATGLADYLKNKNIQNLFVMGLATDYCVKFTCLDAIALGFHVHLIVSGCRGVELSENDVARAMEEMEQAGVEIID